MLYDDLKIFSKVTTIADCEGLQGDLSWLENYCTINSLFLNINKCYFMSLTRNRSPILFNYMLHNSPVKKVKYLTTLVSNSNTVTGKEFTTLVFIIAVSLLFVLRNSTQRMTKNTLTTVIVAN